MSIAKKTETVSLNNVTISENVQRVYDSGYSEAQSNKDLEIWKILTANGSRTVYAQAFWSCIFPSGYTFVKSVTPKSCERMFYNMDGGFPKNIDLSGLTALSGSSTSNNTYAVFAWTAKATVLHDMGMPAPEAYVSTWAYCRSLKTIEKIRVKKETQFLGGAIGTPFQECFALENITFEGEIGQNLRLDSSSKLTHDSLMNIINCLHDYASEGNGTTHTLTIGSTNISKLTADELSIIRNKGWTYA